MAKREPSQQQDNSESLARKRSARKASPMASCEADPSASSSAAPVEGCTPRSEWRLCHTSARLARKEGTAAPAAGGTAAARARRPHTAAAAVLLGAGGSTVAAKKRTDGARAASQAASRGVLRQLSAAQNCFARLKAQTWTQYAQPQGLRSVDVLPSSLDSARASVRNWTELESLSQPLQGKSTCRPLYQLGSFLPEERSGCCSCIACWNSCAI